MIKKVKIENFRTFKKLDLTLDNFNILIGNNASGKSNFIQIFKFIRDITNHRLEDAISMQGGIKCLRNMKIGSSKPLKISLLYEGKMRITKFKNKKRNIGLVARKIEYGFSLEFDKKDNKKFRVREDKLSIDADFMNLVKKKKKGLTEDKKIKSTKIIMVNKNGKVSIDMTVSEAVGFNKKDLIPFGGRLSLDKSDKNKLLLQSPYIFAIIGFQIFLEEIPIYDFDPRLSKKSVPFTGKNELEEDGSNLAIILKDINDNKKQRKKFSNLIRDLLPFVDNLDVEQITDKSLFIELKEKFINSSIPAFLISDGTMNVIAMLVVLYFEKNRFIIIEEPERNIHPSLISRIIDMIKDSSKKKQIIVTTHNPELVKHASLNNILFVSRNNDGFSEIKRLNKKCLKDFIDEMGIEELYVQDLLK